MPRTPCLYLLIALALFAVQSRAEPAGGTRPSTTLPEITSSESPKKNDSPVAASGPSWLVRAQDHIEAREYWASQTASGLQAPNRRQGFRTHFGGTGVRVEDREHPGRHLVSLRLIESGRTEAREVLSEGVVSSREGRVELRRGDLVEWFENGPAGLEHGWTLDTRPVGSGPLAFEIEVASATVRQRGQELVLEGPDQRRLRYAKLAAFDATGQSLLASMRAVGSNRIRVEVNDSDAVYPVSVDPILSAAPDTFLESDQAGARFGIRVSSAGDVNGDGFDDVLVGAQNFDAGEVNEGAVFLFLGTPNGIPDANPLGAIAQFESDQAGAGLTHAAAAGDVNGDGYDDVVVGASFYDNPQIDEGIVMLFLGGPTGPGDGDPGNADLILEANDAGAFFGSALSGAGDVNGDGFADVVVGAYLYALDGAVFVYHGSPSGLSSSPARTIVSSEKDAHFGRSVSGGDLDSDGFSDLVVGAELFDTGLVDQGAVFTYMGGPSGIDSGASGRFLTNQVDAHLGIQVAVVGDVNGDGYPDVLVGADDYDSPEVDEGAAWVLLGGPVTGGIGDLTPATAHAQIESDQADAQLGFGLGPAGDVNGDGFADVVVGARFYDAGEIDEGAVFVYLGSSSGIADGTPATADFFFELDQAGAEVGTSVRSAGDVNGDGFDDLIVGAYRFDAGESQEGAAFVLHGSAEGILDGDLSGANTILQSDQLGAGFGTAVAGAGDVNGDGYDDVLVAAPGWDGGFLNEGAVFLFHGSASGVADASPIVAATILEGAQSSSGFGASAAGAGDVNGDGFADIIIGASSFDQGQNQEGAAFVFHGDALGIPDGTTATAASTIEGDQPSGFFGSSVAAAGDVNGDGFADVIVGAESFNTGLVDSGAAFLFHGSSLGIQGSNPASADGAIVMDEDFARLGGAVAGAGDVNGDGFSDVIVGAHAASNGQPNEGRAFVFHGSAIGIPAGNPSNANALIESNQASAFLGRSVAGAGDVNGDGYSDVLVGATLFGSASSGTVFVFHGSSSGVGNRTPSRADTTIESLSSARPIGNQRTVAGIGDVDGDGFGDIMLASDPSSFPVEAFVFHGAPAGVPSGSTANADATISLVVGGDTRVVSAAGAGDVNGDGFADALFGVRDFASGQEEEGGAFVFQGNGGVPGRPVLAEQRTPSLAPVPPYGLSQSPDSFVVSMQADHPDGLGLVKLEIETCPPGVAFGQPACMQHVAPTWVSTSVSAIVTLVETVPGLVEGELYHWRARILRAPISVLNGPALEPPNPSHGPWRRPHGQARAADIRVPEPGFVAGLMAGGIGIAAFGRSRSRASGARARCSSKAS